MKIKIRKIWPLIGAFCFTLSFLSLSANTYSSRLLNINRTHIPITISYSSLKTQNQRNVLLNIEYVFWKHSFDLPKILTNNSLLIPDQKIGSIYFFFNYFSNFKVDLVTNHLRINKDWGIFEKQRKLPLNPQTFSLTPKIRYLNTHYTNMLFYGHFNKDFNINPLILKYYIENFSNVFYKNIKSSSYIQTQCDKITSYLVLKDTWDQFFQSPFSNESMLYSDLNETSLIARLSRLRNIYTTIKLGGQIGFKGLDIRMQFNF